MILIDAFREDKAKEKEHQRQLLKKKSASLESLQMITSKYNHLGKQIIQHYVI